MLVMLREVSFSKFDELTEGIMLATDAKTTT